MTTKTMVVKEKQKIENLFNKNLQKFIDDSKEKIFTDTMNQYKEKLLKDAQLLIQKRSKKIQPKKVEPTLTKAQLQKKLWNQEDQKRVKEFMSNPKNKAKIQIIKELETYKKSLNDLKLTPKYRKELIHQVNKQIYSIKRS